MTTPTTRIAELLCNIFGGNEYHAEAREGAKQGEIYYHPVKGDLTEELIAKHLDGEVVLGTYSLLKDNMVRWIAWDVDCPDLDTAREWALKVIECLDGLPYAVEFSGRKGYHIFLFLEQPMTGKKALEVGTHIRKQIGAAASGTTHIEVFPKQDKLTDSRPMGNLLKLPLGKHPKNGAYSRFVDPFNGWENGNPLDPLDVLLWRCENEKVESLTGGGPEPDVALVDLIVPYWTDGQRHEMAFSLSGFLVLEGWGEDQIHELFDKIIEKTGDEDPRDRHTCITTAVTRYQERKVVRGRQGLAVYLPVAALQRLTELVNLLRAPDTVRQIDELRHCGKPPEEVGRLAANVMWGVLNDDGCKLCRTRADAMFFYDSETHEVMTYDTLAWDSMLNFRFGLNSADRLSGIIEKELIYRIYRNGQIVDIHKGAYWNEVEGKLYVCPGGPEVYILDGDDIQISYNGECGYMFQSQPSYHTPDWDATPVDAWDFMVNDLSFRTSDDAPARPEEQIELLKAWILGFFFVEIFPTKPILAMIGDPGSGKTTAMRRILKLLEGPEAEVLNIPADKPDSFRASIASHRMVVADNIERSSGPWMPDDFNKLATGANFELRKLYYTNEIYLIAPKCFLAFTTVNVPFSEETLFTRLLCLEMEKLDKPIAEHIIQKRIAQNSGAIWADLLRKINKVVKAIKTNGDMPSHVSRLADFTTFCHRIQNCGADVIDGEVLMRGLDHLIASQLKQQGESSQAMNFLIEWMEDRPDEAGLWHSYSDLYQILQQIASAKRVRLKWSSANALTRHLSSMESQLKSDYHAEFTSEKRGAMGKEVRLVKFIVPSKKES